MSRTKVMGILNVTPDSFSDGGDYFSTSDAIEYGIQLWEEGADIIDVGGESTRPGSERPSLSQEMSRTLPVTEALVEAGVTVSIDTQRATVAAAAIEVGATIINDVSGGLTDPLILELAAEQNVIYVAQHFRGENGVMYLDSEYGDVAQDVAAELLERVDACLAAGIPKDNLVLDPGLGFAKNADQNWELLRRLDVIEELGYPLLVGGSRKRFLKVVSAKAELYHGSPVEYQMLDSATLALTTLLAERQIWAVRTHTVRPQREAIAVVERMRRPKDV
ncbi:MAG: dihydropteroate synthase [Propionibacteriaceae bacterium]|jgi:dihydropteroate synthase|nr:dihydropteroate synthase [Propionibacteriaceae bacterium]